MIPTEAAFVIQGAANPDGPPHYLVNDEKGSYWTNDVAKARRFLTAESANFHALKVMDGKEFLVVFHAFQSIPPKTAALPEGAKAGDYTTANRPAYGEWIDNEFMLAVKDRLKPVSP